ncbi:MAG TPA: TonB-dependent receptor, partial [Burkholderiaceae bacterium]|nr:TonB-dependent receptor [Burkholderiaceae bacterium]
MNPSAQPSHVLLALAVAASPAVAQTSAEAALDAVVVTGTRTRDRTVLTSTTPIDVLPGDEVRRAAGPDGSLAAALQTLLPSFNFPRQSNSGAADHVRAAQLRGLSPDQVLVLVNGRRRHTSAVVNLESKTGKGTNPVDFSAIPLNAIKRIEVLRDGAGAQYGSDAIAGVINVILDDAPEGGELAVTAGAHRTNFEPTGQRITDGQSTELQAKAGWKVGEGSVRAGAEWGHRNATNRAGLDQIPFFVNQTPANLALQGQRNYAAGDPDTDRLNLWFNGGLPLAGHDGYAFGTWSRRDTVGAAFFRYPDSSANVPALYPNGYRPETTGRSDDLALNAGLRGTLAEVWDFDAGVGLGRNAFDFGVRNSLNASLGEASPTRFDLGTYRFEQLSATLDLTRPLAVGLAKPATLALGADLRRESFRTTPGDAASFAVGPVVAPAGAQAGPGLTPQDAADVARRVAGLYADLAADLTPDLFADAAARHDHYGDAGGATTGKLSARLAVAPQVALRGAVSSSFRAPSLAQSNFSFTVTDYGDGGAL